MDHFGVRGSMDVKGFSDDRALISLEGVQICCAPWRSEVNTCEDRFFRKKKGGSRYVDSLAILWSRAKFINIGDHIGKTVAIDSYILELTKLVTTRIKVESNKGYPCAPMWVLDE